MNKRVHIDEGMIVTQEFEESTQLMHTKTTYDAAPVLEDNLRARNAAPEFGRYKGRGLVHVARFDEGDIIRLRSMGYNLLSPDKDERKRALLYVQNNEPNLLRVPGKPFAKKKLIWQ